MKSLFPYLVFLCVVQLQLQPAQAQQDTTRATDTTGQDLSGWLNRRFVLPPPAADFVPIEGGNGYAHKAQGATIKFLTFPGTFKNFKKEIAHLQLGPTTLLLDSATQKFNDREYFTLITEEISPDKTKYENFIGLMIVTEFSNVVVNVIGGYPKSKDKQLREKFIQSALALSEE